MIKRSNDTCSLAINLRKSEKITAARKRESRKTRGKGVNEA